MARFLASALRALGGAFGIEGSEVSTSRLDLSGVQLVQDVSHVLSAGRGPGLHGGWTVARIVVPSLGGSTQQTMTLDPYDPQDPVNNQGMRFPVSDEFDLYLFDAWASYSRSDEAATFTEGFLQWIPGTSRYSGPTQGASADPFRILLLWDGAADVPGSANNFIPTVVPASQYPPRFPFLVPRGSSLQVRSIYGDPSPEVDGGSLRVGLLFRYVPRGYPVGP